MAIKLMFKSNNAHQMSGFKELKIARNLTQDSSFEDIAQACIEAYYLPPYPGQISTSDNKRKVNRTLHGGVHAARTAMCAELFIDLYKKYAAELVINTNLEKLTSRDIKLLKLAAVYHDSANTSETMGESEEHANNFRRDLRLLGYEYHEIEPFAQAIENKDTCSPKNFFTKIIHDADCLEIIRNCFGKSDYKKEYLDIFKDLKGHPEFEKELDQIIENHFETVEMIEGPKGSGRGSGSLHVRCEFSDNCYATLESSMKNMFLLHAVIELAKSKKTIDLSKIKVNNLTLLDLFNRKNGPLTKRLLESDSFSLQLSASENDTAISLYQSNGILARIIYSDRIDDEIDTLERNTLAMRKASIENSEQMRRFISEQTGKAFAPEGFKWRPCTFIERQLSISLIALKGSVGVLFDPHPESGTMISHFYKKNIYSYKAASGDLEYYPQKTGGKERGCIDILREKIHKQNKRREGTELDYNLHYYGKATLPHSEILGTYQTNSVIGIFITSMDAPSIKDALLFQAKLGTPLKPIYQYSPQHGLVRVSSEDIIQCVSENKSKEEIERENQIKIKNEIQNQIGNLEKILGTKDSIKISEDGGGIINDYEGYADVEFKFKTYQISIPSDIPEHIIQKIKDHFSNIRLLDLDNDLDCFNPIKWSVNQSVNTIIFKNDYLYISDRSFNDHQKSILGILSNLNILLDPDFAVDGSKMIQEVVDALENQKAMLKLQQKPDDLLTISPEQPVKYIFTHPLRNDIRCECYVKDGLPMIELHLSDGKVIAQETDKLPSIANRYFEQATERLQNHINNIDIKKALSEIGILNLDIRFITQGKSSLALVFDVVPEFNKDAVQEKILILLGLSKWKRFNNDFLQDNYPNYQQNVNQVILSISEVQMIDKFVTRLSLSELKKLDYSSTKSTINTSQTMWGHRRTYSSEAHSNIDSTPKLKHCALLQNHVMK